MNKLDIARVRAGMIVDEPVYAPGSDRLLVQHGIQVTARMIVMLKAYGVTSLAVSVPDSLFIGPNESLSWFLKRFLYNKIDEIAPDFREGNLSDKIYENSRRLYSVVDNIIANKEIIDLCVEIKLVNNLKLFYPAMHSCVYSMLLAAAMGCDDDEIFDIAAAALLQNYGICEMSYLMEYTERDEQQEELWREHCHYGYYIAKERGISDSIAKLILCHHERLDGSGYPIGIAGDNIPLGAKIINLCTEYDEMVFVHKKKPLEIVEYLQSVSDILYDSRLVDKFIKTIPFYPLGSIVRLSNGDVGVVVNIRKNIGPHPVVRVCYNRFYKQYTDTFIVDLGEENGISIIEMLV